MNGMTIRDLHIGDVVRTKVNVPVSGSRIGRVMELSQNSVYLDEKGYFEPDKLEGISLTEVQLLERFGFRHDETQGCIMYGTRVKVFYTMSKSIGKEPFSVSRLPSVPVVYPNCSRQNNNISHITVATIAF